MLQNNIITREVLADVITEKYKRKGEEVQAVYVHNSEQRIIKETFRSRVYTINVDYTIAYTSGDRVRETDIFCCKESKERITDSSGSIPLEKRCQGEALITNLLMKHTPYTPRYLHSQSTHPTSSQKTTRYRLFMEYLGQETFDHAFRTLTVTEQEVLFVIASQTSTIQSELIKILGSQKRGESIYECVSELTSLDLISATQERNTLLLAPTQRFYKRFPINESQKYSKAIRDNIAKEYTPIAQKLNIKQDVSYQADEAILPTLLRSFSMGDGNIENFFIQNGGNNNGNTTRLTDLFHSHIGTALETHTHFSLETMIKCGITPIEREILLEDAIRERLVQLEPIKRDKLYPIVDHLRKLTEFDRSLYVAGAISWSFINHPHLFNSSSRKRFEEYRVAYVRHAAQVAKEVKELNNIGVLISVSIQDPSFSNTFE